MEIKAPGEFLNLPEQQTTLIPYLAGTEACAPEHSWGPGIRDYYLLHYVERGKGYFIADGRRHKVTAGQIFFIFPGNVSYYVADKKEPWEYFWAGFGGARAVNFLNEAGITPENPVITCRNPDAIKSCLCGMIENYKGSTQFLLRFYGYMNILMSHLLENSDSPYNCVHENRAGIYYRRGMEYISQNYSRRLTIEELANFLGINRKYLYAVFKSQCKSSPKECLINFRLNKACELLGNNSLPVSTIAHSVGYSDALLFSKIFKRRYGVSPSQYRALLAQDKELYDIHH